ncbi:SH3 domain-containing protein [Candidatus Formimonas warabiya]|uniref:SH3b domain-containing protein n=1 Tax=Formimonas warabiya TaxID=1761012 RepID=A0A3G1KU31_FORW1|nr:SH3 domain-containing protein [Candidatus Formimonas warabiya]ATW25940.1 hypothetical protein DCMF_15195 [Candidatus Formimonas warabiya]
MTKGRAALLVVAAIVFLTVGFVIGQMVQAAGAIPGTAGDPLVAQSYVEKIVGETVASLQTKLDEMQAKVDDLQEEVDALSGDTGTNKGSGKTTLPQSSNPPAQGKTVVVSGDSANIRTGPGTTYAKVTTLVKGDTATMVSEENGWYKITLQDGKEGWVANWLVEVK